MCTYYTPFQIIVYYIHLDLSGTVVLGAITQPSSVVLERADLLAVVVGHGVGDGLVSRVHSVFLDVRQEVGLLHEEGGPLLGVGGLEDELADGGAQERAHKSSCHHTQSSRGEGIQTEEDVLLLEIQLGLGNETPCKNRGGHTGENGGHKVDLSSSGSQKQESLPSEGNGGGSGESLGHLTN